jgi:hypothetical protein
MSDTCSGGGVSFFNGLTPPLTTNDSRDLKRTGRQRDDDRYSHNDIPDLVQNK